MNKNRGKQFEAVVREAISKVRDISIDRIIDSTNGFKGIAGICDFMVYREPNLLYLECKSIHGNTFPLSNISDTQRTGMYKKSKIKGIYAGVLIWFVDKDVTMYVPINHIITMLDLGYKSIRYDMNEEGFILLQGKKKRVFYDYDMENFVKEVFNGGYTEKN